MSTPDLVKGIRLRTGESQEDLARRLDVSFATVNAWENGRSEPRATHRHRIEQLAAEVGIRQGFQVLVVDDDESSAALERALVEAVRPDADITVALDGSEGLLRCGDIKPDLVLLDIMMPGIDGIGVARRMSAIDGLQHTTVVFVTSVTDDAVLARARAAGALDVLAKPLRRADFERVLVEMGERPTS